MHADKPLRTRLRIAFWSMVVISLVILGKVAYVQRFEGSRLVEQANYATQRFVEVAAKRGSIFSEDGQLLSAQVIRFDVYIDFRADGLIANQGKRFYDNVDTLAASLADHFGDYPKAWYKKTLAEGMRKGDRYYLFKRFISEKQYKAMKAMPLIRQGRNKSGFIFEVKQKRILPHGLAATRTIGLSREYVDWDGKVKKTNVGLERTYDSVLSGESGRKLMRFLGNGKYEPVDGSVIEAVDGGDLVTTLDMYMQYVTENALLKMLTVQEATHGCAIVMETSTGKIKAIANLGRRPDGTYWEDLNYAIRVSEPGHTFSLVTMMALLENKYASLNTYLNLEGGAWKVNGRTVYDAERAGGEDVTLQEAFERGSNVAMAKLAMTNFAKQPTAFTGFSKQLKLHEYSGIDLLGESAPVIKDPRSSTWSATSLPWMSFGYEVLLSPLQVLTLYNAIANKGIMMKPYLVKEVREAGSVRKNDPQVRVNKVCSDATLAMLQQALEGVCVNGSAKPVFQNMPFKVAGKTATTLVANGNRGYEDHIYQSTFAGYFPADKPQYSCIVNICNRPFARVYYGAAVAAPVFREIAAALYKFKIVP